MKPTVRILSLGAGVQSTTLALMACDGTLPGLDAAIFADTGWEPKHVYEQVDRIEKLLTDAGIPLYRVTKGNIRTDLIDDPSCRFISVPYYMLSPSGSRGMGRRQCTEEYKLKPILRQIRALLGAKPPKYRRVPSGRVAEQWIGFSTDEIGRADNKRRNLYTTKRFPLLDLGMSRKDCVRYLKRAGWGHTAKSACIGCPLHGNSQWRNLRDNYPDEWADAVAADEALRNGGARARSSRFEGQAFLHRSFLPLSIAPIDRLSHRDFRELQGDLFDPDEDGDPDGCSPYGCRSGEPVEVSYQPAECGGLGEPRAAQTTANPPRGQELEARDA